MHKINYFLTAVLFLAGSMAAFAQTAPVRGEVKLKKADGTETPVAGAAVDAYRTDIGKGKMPSAKTNKKGEFQFVGLTLGQTYALAVSGPGIAPQVEAGIRAGNEKVVIIVIEGDGRVLTEAEARSGAASVTSEGEMSAEEKMKRAELERKNAEILAGNKKIQEADELVKTSNAEGVAAMNAKDYSTAIAKFDAGIAAVPDYIGSTPIMLKNKAIAHKARGLDSYNEGAKSTDYAARKPKMEQANKDYDQALAAYDAAVAVIQKAAAPTTPEDTKNRTALNLELLAVAMEVHRLKSLAEDTAKGKEAAAVFARYDALETDAVKKSRAKMTIADILRNNGDCDAAVVEYKNILAVTTDDPDALAGAGLCLFNLGYINDNNAQLQEGLNYMQRFSDIAPDTHKLKSSVKDAVENLKTEKKLAPQKVSKKKT